MRVCRFVSKKYSQLQVGYLNIISCYRLGATKREKVRTVDSCDTLAAILRAAKMEQRKNRLRYGPLYNLNYYTEVKEKDRIYYKVYTLPVSEEAPDGYRKAPLSVYVLMEHLKRQTRLGLCAGRRGRKSRDWRTSTSTCFVTRSRAICCRTAQRPRMYRNCLDTLMSVPR